MNIDMKTIGTRIKKRRIELGLKQMEIKDAVGISSGNLSDIENGNRAPSMTTLYRLSQILNCSIDWMVTGESPNTENPSTSLSGDSLKLLTYFNAISHKDQEELLILAELKYNRTQDESSNLSSSPKDDNAINIA